MSSFELPTAEDQIASLRGRLPLTGGEILNVADALVNRIVELERRLEFLEDKVWDRGEE